MKGFSLTQYDRKILSKTLTINLEDPTLAEFGLSIFEKFPVHYWNQAKIIASNMPLFLLYNGQAEQTLKYLKTHPEYLQATTFKPCTPRSALMKAFTLAQALEQAKFEEQKASVEYTLADPEQLNLYNEIQQDGSVINPRYQG